MNLKKSDHLNMSFPLPESFSNVSPHQESKYFSIKCPTHPRFDLTNICLSKGCIEPMCPECVKHHLKIHNELNSECKAETLVLMRENCMENVQSLLNEFMKEKKRLHGWMDKKVFPHDQVLGKIKQAKENLLNMIFKFFDFIEKNVNSFITNYKVTHQEEFNQLSSKIHALIEDLQMMQIELNSSEYIKCMLKLLNQGFSADLEALKKEISEAFEAWETNSNNYIIDETKLYSINLELMKYIRTREGKTFEKGIIQSNLQTNLSEIKRANMSKEFYVETLDGQDKFKNFQNFLEYTMKSPDKGKKRVEGREKSQNQREILKSINLQPTTTSEGHIHFESSNEMRVNFEAPNFFAEDCSDRLLSFFQDNSKKFHFIDLKTLEKFDQKYRFEEKDLLIEFKIPLYHRSIITPLGEIFLTGGIDPSHKSHAINKVYQMDLKTASLVPKMHMNQARYSHSLCFAMKYIFASGGVFDINEGYLDSFEKYDIDFGEWIVLTPSPTKSMGGSLCNFNERMLYKFGGKTDNAGFSNYIERYDILKNTWNLLSIQPQKTGFRLPTFMNSYQISSEEIMVFGGNINEIQFRSIFILRVNEFIKNEEVKFEEKLREIKMEINAPGSFWNQAIMHEGVLLSAQNLQIDKSKELCHFGKKRVIICNSEIWKDL